MSKNDDAKPQYVDVSFGWQERGDEGRMRERRRRRWWFAFFVFFGGPLIAYVSWWLMH